MGWAIVLGILLFLAWLPLGLDLRYDDRGLQVDAKILKIPIRVYPRKEKPEETPQPPGKKEENVEKPPATSQESGRNPPKPEKIPVPRRTAQPKPEKAAPQPIGTAAEKLPKTEAPQKEKASEAPKGGSLRDFLPLIRLGLDLLGDFRRKLRVDRLELDLILAGNDPCDLAVNYGRAWAALGNLIPKLEQYFVIKKRNLEVQCDFQAAEITLTARVEISITLGRLLVLAARYGIRGLREFLHLRKGGAEL